MADNTTLPVSVGTEVFANDDIAGVKYPRAKLALGADGSAADAVGGAGAVTAGVQRVTLASDDPLLLLSTDGAAGEYETVAASQTTQSLGATGALGDYLESLVVVPATVSPGAISIKDGSEAAITVFAGGTNSLSDLSSFSIILGLKSRNGAWQVTTGANISVIACGNFT